MNDNITNTDLILFSTSDENISVPVLIRNDTMWLSLSQIAELFSRDKSVISRHLKNIFDDEELLKNSVVAFFATTATDGKTYNVEHFNLDAIISVGYRVNSKRGTEFRKWSNEILKSHIIQGYSINHNKIGRDLVTNLQNTIDILASSLKNKEVAGDTSVEILNIIKRYSVTWELLLRYDEDRLHKHDHSSEANHVILDLKEALDSIAHFKNDLMQKKQASDLFGRLKDNGLDAILSSIEQTFDGNALYNSFLEKAAHLLYFIIKDHPFTDGNKRIASLLFIIYLNKNNYNTNLIANNTLTALTLLIAESNPSTKETMIDLIINLLNQTTTNE